LPALAATGHALLLILAALWRRRDPKLQLRAWPLFAALAIAGALAFFAMRESGGRASLLWSPLVVATACPVYLSVLLVSWRVWFAIHPQSSFEGAFVPALTLIGGAALALLCGWCSPAMEAALNFALWDWPATDFLLVPLVLPVLIVVEPIARAHLDRGGNGSPSGSAIPRTVEWPVSINRTRL
jgi:hypothetical protein